VFYTPKNHEWIAKRLSINNKPSVEIASVMEAARNPIVLLDSKLCVEMANEPFYQSFHVAAKEANSKKIYEYGNGEWDTSRLRVLLEGILEEQINTKDFEVEKVCPNKGRRRIRVNAFRLKWGSKKSLRILLGFEDITADPKDNGQKQKDDEQRKGAEELKKVKRRLETLQAESKGHEKKLREDSKQLSKAEKRLSDMQEANEKLQHTVEELRKAQLDVQADREELRRVKDTVSGLQEALQKASDERLKTKGLYMTAQEELEQAEGRFAEMKETCESLREELAESEKTKERHLEAKQELMRKMETVDDFVKAAEEALKAAKRSGANSVSIWSNEKAADSAA
jgi:DNA repair exonuclease SbcCD ATPase subunit